MLILLKLTVTPILVALVSLAARRWGPTIGGLIMGLPWMTGPILFFLGLERGEAYVARASAGVLAGVVGVAAYILVFVITARSASWRISLTAAFVAFAATGYAISGFGLSLWIAAVISAVVLGATYFAMPRVSDAGDLRGLPWWDIPMRMLATALLVLVVMISTDLLGPERSGIVATYPVILSVVMSFTHAQWGWPAVVRLARGVSLSLLSFVGFFLVLGVFVKTAGLTLSYTLATATALLSSLAMILANGAAGVKLRGIRKSRKRRQSRIHRCFLF